MDLARDAGEVADQLDELVKPAREPQNAVLTDNARVVRWAGPAFVLQRLHVGDVDVVNVDAPLGWQRRQLAQQFRRHAGFELDLR